MQGTLDADGTVRLGGDARQRFYDSSGYGRPTGGDGLELAPVEAAHLLQRGDLDAVVADGKELDFRAFLARTGAVLAFVVYKDLRDRGFYLSPAGREAESANTDADAVADADATADFVVYPRGSGPWDDEVAYRVRVVGERESILVRTLGDVVLAIVDEDGELTYFETARETPGGTLDADPPAGLVGTLLADRVLVWEPPDALYEDHFYGQRLYGRNADAGPIQLSLVEAAHLARRGALTVVDGENGTGNGEVNDNGEVDGDGTGTADVNDAGDAGDAAVAVVARGRDVEGDRFDRRLRAYTAIRAAGGVPKSGFKFGADFRVYESFSTVSELSHSDSLVRVVPRGHAALPRDLSLDVRLAGGVRKRMVFALTDANGGVDWLSAARLTP
ncbi:tRNA-intron lyase [Salinigranum sp. GCM10025319]|uniref:tRNA-intron lyase n=1 Tax=Salinigranum sp. GCM10025319 TaxID=3252687 RepID=UPI00361E1D79